MQTLGCRISRHFTYRKEPKYHLFWPSKIKVNKDFVYKNNHSLVSGSLDQESKSISWTATIKPFLQKIARNLSRCSNFIWLIFPIGSQENQEIKSSGSSRLVPNDSFPFAIQSSFSVTRSVRGKKGKNVAQNASTLVVFRVKKATSGNADLIECYYFLSGQMK